MKKLFVTIALAAIQVAAIAQTVNVHFKNGQTIKYNSDNVDYVDFSEKAPDPTVAVGQVIDLGLSVYWASCNLGAENPEEYGSYYAWGETTPKSSYKEDNYSYYDNNTKQYIIIGDDISGTEYDAATVNLGGDWRMPTEQEMQELVEMCTWEWTQINGINGYRIVAMNGNSIFLPAAGYNSYFLSELNETLLYSTSTVSSYSSIYMQSLNGRSDGSYHVKLNSKYSGVSIRPVTNNPNATGLIIDHSQDYLVTSNVSAHFLGGSVMSIGDRIQSGSQLNVQFTNASNQDVTLIAVQLNDSETGNEGNNLLTEEVLVPAGTKQGYTITVGILGIYKPVISFSYRYNNKYYKAEATWSGN